MTEISKEFYDVQKQNELNFANFNTKTYLLPFAQAEASKYPELNQEYLIEALISIYANSSCAVQAVLGAWEKFDDDIQTKVSILQSFIDNRILVLDPLKGKLSARIPLSSNEKEPIYKFGFPLPLVVPPRKLRNNYDSGYYTTSECIVKNLKDIKCDYDVNLEHINLVNSIPMTLNISLYNHEDIMEYAFGSEPTYVELHKFEQAKSMAQTYYQEYPMWLTHSYDTRGRYYCNGYQFTYQNRDFDKALIIFSNGKDLY